MTNLATDGDNSTCSWLNVVIVLLAFMLLGWVCYKSYFPPKITPEQQKQRLDEAKKASEAANLKRGEELASEILYFQDHRTGLCFGYMWGGAANGGPAFTLVPYEKVKDFLVNPDKKPSEF